MKKILEEIKGIEDDYNNKLENAKKKKEGIITDAKKDSLHMMTSEKQKITKKIDEKTKKREEELASERAKIENQGKKDSEGIRKKAEKNKEKAVSFVLDRFHKRIE